MSISSQIALVNGNAMNGNANRQEGDAEIKRLNDALRVSLDQSDAFFHGDALIADKVFARGFLADWRNNLSDFRNVLSFKNLPDIGRVIGKALSGGGLDLKAGASLIASLPNDSNRRAIFTENQVKNKYERMLHPPLTYLGDAFKYRAADGKFNSALNPHLGQAGAPYAKTVPSKTHPLGALPPAADIFDRLMAREKDRPSTSGLSSMLIYHATIIIHDIFRTNDGDKNISDTSSYLDLSPLYGYNEQMQRSIRDDKYKLGLLKPDTFAEDRLLRQPPGVCIMLVMYNRYHNYAATQLRRINENGRFSVPAVYVGSKLAAAAAHFVKAENKDQAYQDAIKTYENAWESFEKNQSVPEGEPPKPKEPVEGDVDFLETNKIWSDYNTTKKEYDSIPKGEVDQKQHAKVVESYSNAKQKLQDTKRWKDYEKTKAEYWTLPGHSAYKKIAQQYGEAKAALEAILHATPDAKKGSEKLAKFYEAYDTAWNKLDDDLFQTARLITCGMYIQISIHDYLRALMGFHQWNTDFTLDPRIAMTEHRNVSRGLGNQVTVEFNLLYRFHCAISAKDEKYAGALMESIFKKNITELEKMSLGDFARYKDMGGPSTTPPWKQEFGLPGAADHPDTFKRDPITGLFSDKKMVDALVSAMDDPISNFGPKNVPKFMKNIEVLGIMQARKWEIGTLNDFRDFFGLKRHWTFESISGNVKVQNALRDLYEHPDKVELYPGIFCESDANMNADPGPSDLDSALWAAIFSDAITLVRSDRFYTVDWNTNSLTSWGMKEVTEDGDVLKGSVFHRLLQRAFPEWFPYDSVRFFHPFYTAKQNAKYAQQQGYDKDFKLVVTPRSNAEPVSKDKFNYDFTKSNPKLPVKPIYLDTISDIQDVLADLTDIVHPARLQLEGLPTKVQELLTPAPTKAISEFNVKNFVVDDGLLIDYFIGLTRQIVKRESITMNEDMENPVYQIDIAKDLAIPVVTRYMVDFLGVDHLVKSELDPHAKYSENEIYQHITNCQQFLSYNADETKMLKRRKAYRVSMTFLFNLARQGSIHQANKWPLSRWLTGLFSAKAVNPMSILGFKLAGAVLKQEGDVGKATAIFLLIALDSAYQNVLSFTAVLNSFLVALYSTAANNVKVKADVEEDKRKVKAWLKIQELAFERTQSAFDEIKKIVLFEQRISVKLPIVKIAVRPTTLKLKNPKKTVAVEQGQSIICDTWSAQRNQKQRDIETEEDLLAYSSSFTDRFAPYDPKHIAVLALTAMMKVVGQMKTLRFGHESQGRLKRVRLDASSEGYSNYMARMRINRIKADQQRTSKGDDDTQDSSVKHIFKPETHTYLTPEWNEMISFPSTWKLRFDGYGKSEYEKDFSRIREDRLPDDKPPFYQPNGPSHTGGSFTDAICTCTPTTHKDTTNTSSVEAIIPPAVVSGCGIPIPA